MVGAVKDRKEREATPKPRRQTSTLEPDLPQSRRRQYRVQGSRTKENTERGAAVEVVVKRAYSLNLDCSAAGRFE